MKFIKNTTNIKLMFIDVTLINFPANGIMTLAGGVVITFAKEILNLITGG